MQDETSGKDIGVDLDIEILKWQETGMSPPMNGIDCCRDQMPRQGFKEVQREWYLLESDSLSLCL